MIFPIEVPILTPEECKNVQLWQLIHNAFPDSIPEAVSALSHVHAALYQISKTGPFNHNATRKAILFNVTAAYLGYIEGQSSSTLSLLAKVQTVCHRQSWFEK